MSHPTWVRGLKLVLHLIFEKIRTSHPTWVRGLKHGHFLKQDSQALSHPTWVRGLKPFSVNWAYKQTQVAPYVGAWIETDISSNEVDRAFSRTLRGCVD